ncbi:MAG: hypothetical protein IPK50_06465 [Fibrobacterota bacterium]|nr:MAG: hypothetical protein IPK50_06465 [Fibrobacterota bacterium]
MTFLKLIQIKFSPSDTLKKLELSLTEEQQLHGKSLWNNKTLQKSVLDDIKEFKKLLKEELLKSQNYYCCYCHLPFHMITEQSGKHIEREHIFSKKTYKDYSFTLFNLALCCNICNGPGYKHVKNVCIQIDEVDFHKSQSKIIHPHFDKTQEHLKLNQDLTISHLTSKGDKNCKYFKLNDPRKLDIRSIMRQKDKLPPSEQKKYEEIISFQRT